MRNSNGNMVAFRFIYASQSEMKTVDDNDNTSLRQVNLGFWNNFKTPIPNLDFMWSEYCSDFKRAIQFQSEWAKNLTWAWLP